MSAELVTSVDEVRKNVLTLASYNEGTSSEREFFIRKIRNGRNFVAVRVDGGYAFAPSKFAGYLDNDISHDSDLDNRNGGATDTRISTFVAEVAPGSRQREEIESAFLLYCSSLGITPSVHPRTRRYWLIEGESEVRNPPWTRDELILALDLYLRHRSAPPGKQSREVAELSATLNALSVHLATSRNAVFRNTNGVYMKMMNFRSLDPLYTTEGKVGLTRGNKLDAAVWSEFVHDPARLAAVAAAIRAAVSVDPVANLEDDTVTEAVEGRVLTRLHRIRERDRKLVERRKAKALRTTGRLQCEACGFDFHARYGDRGRGFIECHHVRPVHTLASDGERTTEDDLALVCANCHRMIHASRPWAAVEELRTILGLLRTSAN